MKSIIRVCASDRIGWRALIAAGIFFNLLMLVSPSFAQSAASNADDGSAEFKQLAQELSTNRLESGTEGEAQQEKALSFLDRIVLSNLNASTMPNLEALNQKLAGFTFHTRPVGENYRVLKLGDTPLAYGLVVNFGQGGPAAVRIYAGAPSKFVLAARVDQFSQKGFFDSDIELIPVSISNDVFITAAGRTDDLSTGIFSAWRFDGHAVVPLWTSDLLQQSNYEVDANEFHFSYCGEPDEDHPDTCLQMRRDLYRFQDGQWKRIESVDIPPVKPPTK